MNMINENDKEIPKWNEQMNMINTNEHDKEMPKERYKPPEERQKFIDEMRLI